jgi:hypothetical protein
LPHALPHLSVATWAAVLTLIDGVLLRLLQLLHGLLVTIFLSVRG